MSSASPHQRMIIGTLIAGAAMLAALWMLAISPKRAESAEVKESVAAQEQRLDDARRRSSRATRQSRKQYPGHARRAQAPRRGGPGARRDLRPAAPAAEAGEASQQRPAVAALKPSSGAADRRHHARLTPGASPRPRTASRALPFTFTYTRQVLRPRQVLAAARKAVTVRSGDLKIDGRLVTIEGVSFAARGARARTMIKASVSGTAYIAAAPPHTASTAAAPAADAPGRVMMLRSLVDEVVRRRLWPIPLVALLVAIAAPLLFMKSAPPAAPAAPRRPPAAAPGKLPTKRAAAARRRATRRSVPRKRSTRKAPGSVRAAGGGRSRPRHAAAAARRAAGQAERGQRSPSSSRTPTARPRPRRSRPSTSRARRPKPRRPRRRRRRPRRRPRRRRSTAPKTTRRAPPRRRKVTLRRRALRRAHGHDAALPRPAPADVPGRRQGRRDVRRLLARAATRPCSRRAEHDGQRRQVPQGQGRLPLRRPPRRASTRA